MTEYQIDLLHNGSPVAGWTGPADNDDHAVSQARAAHPGAEHLDAEVTKL